MKEFTIFIFRSSREGYRRIVYIDKRFVRAPSYEIVMKFEKYLGNIDYIFEGFQYAIGEKPVEEHHILNLE